MSLTTVDKIMLCAGLSGFVGLFIWLGVAVYIAYTKLDFMLSLLKNCPAVMNRTVFLNTGPWGRLFVLGGVISLMVTPRIYLRDGGASVDDFKRFPSDLKLKLIILHWSGMASLLIVLGVVAVDELILG